MLVDMALSTNWMSKRFAQAVTTQGRRRDVAKTNIDWSELVWNPTTGCTPISPGCKHCYAKAMHARLAAMGQPKYARPFEEVVFHYDTLTLPIRWHEPRRIFVDSMSDLFHDDLTHEQIAAVYGVACICRQHTFQICTKRPGRAAQWHEWARTYAPDDGGTGPARAMFDAICCSPASFPESYDVDGPPLDDEWPPPNVHLIASCEDQRRADERIPLLLQCPAAVRGVSLEPLLGPIDLTHIDAEAAGHADYCVINAVTGRQSDMGRPCPDVPSLQWVIVGCESGPGRRPCEIDWIRDIVRQCRSAGTPCFVKQVSLGGKVSSKPWQWPLELRVRMFPGERWN
jgi:protein gp37